MKKRIPSIDEFINENSSSSVYKKGDKVARLMMRDNPQLGTYYVFDEKVVEKITGKTVVCDGEIYNKETGERKNSREAAYGSAYYSIMTIEDAKKEFKRLKDAGERVRGMESILA